MADQNNDNSDKKEGRNLVKISDLPVYPDRGAISPTYSKMLEQREDFEESIRKLREKLVNNLSFLGDAFQVSKGYYEHGLDKTKQLYGSLTDEKEQTTKVVAIASGGLIGLALSLRKGVFKKVLYTTTFASSVGAFCYPKTFKEYSEIASYITKNKITPAVNSCIQEYTGLDLNEQFKNFNESLPDLSSLKNLWSDKKSFDKKESTDKKD